MEEQIFGAFVVLVSNVEKYANINININNNKNKNNIINDDNDNKIDSNNNIRSAKWHMYDVCIKALATPVNSSGFVLLANKGIYIPKKLK